ncbi:MAG: hypothetical protein OXC31_16345 [Spirochaetaceae bacterium]|nr:hypothetical protein [Spirochaetaceae bacterium]
MPETMARRTHEAHRRWMVWTGDRDSDRHAGGGVPSDAAVGQVVMSAPAVGALVAVLLFAGVPGYATAQDAEQNEMTIAERVRHWLAAEEAAGRGGSDAVATTMPIGLLAELESRGMMRYQVLMEGSRLALLTDAERFELQELMRERFALWTNCAPLLLSVGEVDTSNEAGLTHGSLQNLAETRLRAARLYGDERSPVVLSLYVGVFRAAFTIQLELWKHLADDELSNRRGFATTWSSSPVGMYGAGGANYILGVVSQTLDSFLVEYLRVNEDAC